MVFGWRPASNPCDNVSCLHSGILQPVHAARSCCWQGLWLGRLPLQSHGILEVTSVCFAQVACQWRHHLLIEICVCDLQGDMSAWIEHQLGLGPDNLYPSVRFALETALLALIASAKQTSIASLLQSSIRDPAAAMPLGIQVNALIGGTSSPEEAADTARNLVQQGYLTIKIKVPSPSQLHL